MRSIRQFGRRQVTPVAPPVVEAANFTSQQIDDLLRTQDPRLKELNNRAVLQLFEAFEPSLKAFEIWRGGNEWKSAVFAVLTRAHEMGVEVDVEPAALHVLCSSTDDLQLHKAAQQLMHQVGKPLPQPVQVIECDRVETPAAPPPPPAKRRVDEEQAAQAQRATAEVQSTRLVEPEHVPLLERPEVNMLLESLDSAMSLDQLVELLAVAEPADVLHELVAKGTGVLAPKLTPECAEALGASVGKLDTFLKNLIEKLPAGVSLESAELERAAREPAPEAPEAQPRTWGLPGLTEAACPVPTPAAPVASPVAPSLPEAQRGNWGLSALAGLACEPTAEPTPPSREVSSPPAEALHELPTPADSAPAERRPVAPPPVPSTPAAPLPTEAPVAAPLPATPRRPVTPPPAEPLCEVPAPTAAPTPAAPAPATPRRPVTPPPAEPLCEVPAPTAAPTPAAPTPATPRRPVTPPPAEPLCEVPAPTAAPAPAAPIPAAPTPTKAPRTRKPVDRSAAPAATPAPPKAPRTRKPTGPAAAPTPAATPPPRVEAPAAVPTEASCRELLEQLTQVTEPRATGTRKATAKKTTRRSDEAVERLRQNPKIRETLDTAGAQRLTAQALRNILSVCSPPDYKNVGTGLVFGDSGNERVEPQAVGAFVNHLGQLTRGATLPTSPAAYAPPPPVAPAQQPWQAFSNPAMYQLGNRALNGFDAPLANQMMTCAGPQLPAMASALYPQTWNAYPMNAYSYPGAWYQTPFTAPMTNPAWQMAGAAAAWTIGSAMWSCYPANMFGYNLMWSGWPYAMAMW